MHLIAANAHKCTKKQKAANAQPPLSFFHSARDRLVRPLPLCAALQCVSAVAAHLLFMAALFLGRAATQLA